MKLRNINLPQSFSRHTVNLCTSRNIYSVDELILHLKLGKRITQMTGNSKRSYNEILNALPRKIKSDYLNRSIDITQYFSIDYALSRGDEELYFHYKIDSSSKYLFLYHKIDSYKKFMSFLKKKIRIVDLSGAKMHNEMSMFCLMPEYIRGWYNRLHILGLDTPFESVNSKRDKIDHEFLNQLSPRAKNLAINYGLYNQNHLEAAFDHKINLGNLHGIGKTSELEFRQLIGKTVVLD